MKKMDEAKSYYKKVLEINTNHIGSLQSLGLLYFTKGEYLKAQEQFRRATEIDSTYYPAWVGLGASSSLSDQTLKADSILNRLLAVDTAMALQMMDIITAKQQQKNKMLRDQAKDSLKN